MHTHAVPARVTDMLRLPPVGTALGVSMCWRGTRRRHRTCQWRADGRGPSL
jgi:hypothetical protein